MFISNEKIKFIVSLFFVILGLLFSFKDILIQNYRNNYEFKFVPILGMFYKKIDHCFFSYEQITKIKNYDGKYISIINVGTFSNILPIFLEKIPVNYYIFYANTVINNSITWQYNEIKNLVDFDPSIVLISKSICKVIQNDDLIINFLYSNYNLIESADLYLIFMRR